MSMCSKPIGPPIQNPSSGSINRLSFITPWKGSQNQSEFSPNHWQQLQLNHKHKNPFLSPKFWIKTYKNPQKNMNISRTSWTQNFQQSNSKLFITNSNESEPQKPVTSRTKSAQSSRFNRSRSSNKFEPELVRTQQNRTAFNNNNININVQIGER